MHLLLAGAVVLGGWPPVLKWLGLAAVIGHALWRRPARTPSLVLVVEGGACGVPEWQTGLRTLGPRTVVAPGWVRLDFGPGPWQRELLLIADQVDPDDWRLLRAMLARARGD